MKRFTVRRSSVAVPGLIGLPFRSTVPLGPRIKKLIAGSVLLPPFKTTVPLRIVPMPLTVLAPRPVIGLDGGDRINVPPPFFTQLAVPTYTGTPDMNPGIGSLTLEDDFSDDSVWDTAQSEHASAAISRNRLTLVVKSGYYLASMRRELPLSDFYAEITARPSLCRGEDNYGVVVRGVGSSFYRFVLACNRQIRAERISGGTKLTIQEPLPSGDAPGAPGEVRIGVWAVGSEMRLFLNGRYQFSMTDPSFPIGAFGVFVRSTGETPVTVTFSELEVYEVNYIPPTKTPLPQ